jgi:hypothetical protein
MEMDGNLGYVETVYKGSTLKCSELMIRVCNSL